jgi:hypothetical protein
MKRWILAFMVCTLAISTTVIAQNVIDAENVDKRKIGSFHAVETGAGIQVILTKGNEQELVVTSSHKEMLDKIKTTVTSNGVLRISRENNWRFWETIKNWSIKVYVPYSQLDGLDVSSGGSIQVKDVNLDKLTAEVSSGGSISISGKANSLVIDGSSGGMFKGYDLTVTNCKVDVSSGAGVQVNVSKEISAEASSGAYVRFKGEGLIRNINVSSGGSVKRTN